MAEAQSQGVEDFTLVGYPASQVPKLTPHVQGGVDTASYALLLYFTVLRLFLKKATKTAKARCAGMASLLLYLITANVLAVAVDYPRTAAQQLVSFLVLMLFIRSLRESWKRIFLVVWDSLAIMVIILAYLLFFSLVGYTLFSNPAYVDPEAYFRDIPTSIFNVYVLFTTSNFPDILFPFWKVNNWAALYFVGFLLVGLYMLLNLMLAVFYNGYKTRAQAKIAKYDSLREEFLRAEFAAAGAGPHRDHITPAEFRAKYGSKVIEQSEKVLPLLEGIEQERDLGVSDGLVYYDDFAYMYMFLEFSDHKKQHRKAAKQQASGRGAGGRRASGSASGGKAGRRGTGGSGDKSNSLKKTNTDDSLNEPEEISSEDSFESDSDFDDLEEAAAQDSRVKTENGEPKGFKKKSFFGHMYKRT